MFKNLSIIAIVFFGLSLCSHAQNNLYPISDHGKYGYIDQKGNIVISPDYTYAGKFFDGLAIVKKEGKKGFIDKTGKIVINPEYQSGYEFSDGLACVKPDGGSKFGFIDKKGELVISTTFDHHGEFENGLASIVVGNLKTGKLNYIDKTGKTVWPK